ncbi:MAG: hypothetical protein F6K16_35500, partial [Symploca sp. SIO2B6]|nr:hypothetical protein [Symploca sp. SIO2B6]
MRLSWRNIVIIVGISFSLGAVVASHRAILAQLSQATAAFSALDLPGVRSIPGGGGTPGANSSTTSTHDPSVSPSPTASPSATTSQSPATQSLAAQSPDAQPMPTDWVPDSVFAPERGDLRVIIFSDINGRYRSTTYRQEVINSIRLIPVWEPDLVLLAGDMVAGQLLSLTPEEIQAMWEGFDRHIFQPIRQAGVPFGVAIGKHDGSSQVFEEDAFKDAEPAFVDAQGIPSGIPGTYIFAQERTAAQAYWTDPARDLGLALVDGVNLPFRYSFVQNDVFVLVWDASSSDISEDDLAWAEQQLSSPAAQQAKMRLSMGHFPLYAVAQGRDRPSEFLTRGP